MGTGKMADNVNSALLTALETISSTTESSGNMKKQLKQTIFDTVSKLRKLFMKLIETNNSNTREICELEKTVTNLRQELEQTTGRVERERASDSAVPSSDATPETGQSDKAIGPSDGATRTLFSEVVGGKFKKKTYKITVLAKDNQTAETTKQMLKAHINPTEIRVGVHSLKALKDGRVLIETNSSAEADTLTKNIRDKCGDKLEANVNKPRAPRMKIHNVPEEISIENIEEILLAQNTELGLITGDINPKFIYTTKTHTRNLVIEVGPQIRNKLMHHKLKLGWHICGIEDYLVATRCFHCSRIGHTTKFCRNKETCPLCTGEHNLKDCKAQPTEVKCINCHTYNLHNKNANINTNHTTLDRKCPSILAVLEKYRQNTDYGT
jgi:hypothetical protein